MRRALIGHTGFVGSNLAAAGGFTDFYNSSSISTIEGQHFDEIVCAGVSAVKWLANKEPDKDRAGIARLTASLNTVTARRFTLISTIDVYPDPSQPLDEDFDLTDLDNHAYGRHRLSIEAFVKDRFDDVLIARLPALFGPGLKKNLLFDLLVGNDTVKINPASSYQWYPLNRLSDDLAKAWNASLALVNLFPEPVETRTIINSCFADVSVGPEVLPAPRYDLRTKYGAMFGGGNYLFDASAAAESIEKFVDCAKRDRAVLGR